jgi:hypothetical protein
MGDHVYNYLRRESLLVIISYVFLFIISCADKSQWATKINWNDLDLADLPSQADFPDESAIILTDDGRMEVFGDPVNGFSTFERHKIIKILNIRGHRYANIVLPYYPTAQIENIRARTIKPGGEIVVLDKDDIFDVNLYPNFVFYSDQRAKIFTMPAIENGAIVEYKYRVDIRKRTLWHSWIFQDEIPTLLSRFSLIHPSEWKLDYRAYNIDQDPEVLKTPAGFRSTYRWEMRNVPPVKSEFAMPNLKEIVSRLAFSPVGIKSWQDVASWYYELIDPQIKPDKDIENHALTLTTGCKTDKEKLQNIYEWVRDNVRYIAVEIGIGSYQPNPAEKVLDNHYGDCKDMATLICALAKEASLEVYEVLISTRQNGLPDTTLPSPYHFNHAIAYCPTVGDGGTWMDATEKGCPFGQLPWYDQGVYVLIVAKNGKAEIRKTPVLPPDINRTHLVWHIEVDNDGVSHVKAKTAHWGALAVEIREDLLYASQDEIKNWLEVYLAKRCYDAKLDTFYINGLVPVLDPLEIFYTFRTENFLIERENQIIIRPSTILSMELPNYFLSTERIYPVQFQFGFTEQMDLHVKLSDLFNLKSIQYQNEDHSPFGMGKWILEETDNMIHWHSMCQIVDNRIPVEEYSDFQKFLKTLKTNELREIILTKKD